MSQSSHPSIPTCFSCDAYLFDIDGTLLNSRDGVHYHAFHHAVRDVFGIDSSIDGVPVHGNTDIGILRAVVHRAGLSDADFECLLPQALLHMNDEVRRNQRDLRPELCPSVRDLLEMMRRTGKLMGVVSGNLETVGWLKLRAAGIAGYFSFGCFSAHAGDPSAMNTFVTAEHRADIFRDGIGEARARLGQGASVCAVGDTPSDIAAAREARIPVIAVATGVFTLEQLRKHEPDACALCCTELLQPFLERMHH